jgi:hypothetical protein
LKSNVPTPPGPRRIWEAGREQGEGWRGEARREVEVEIGGVGGEGKPIELYGGESWSL